jgi:hypothetical protein
MVQLTYDAPASPPPDEKERKRTPPSPAVPEPDDEAPETPPSEPAPVPVQDPPSEPGKRGPYVV